MSLERELLWEEVKARLEDFYSEGGTEYDIVKYLWKVIIMDNPVDGVKVRGDKRLWKNVPKDKSLFTQVEGRGIVIGNLTSQLLSNIYLNKLDRLYCRRAWV